MCGTLLGGPCGRWWNIGLSFTSMGELECLIRAAQKVISTYFNMEMKWGLVFGEADTQVHKGFWRDSRDKNTQRRHGGYEFWIMFITSC